MEERQDLDRLGVFLKRDLCACPVARITNTGAVAETCQRRKGKLRLHLKKPHGSSALGEPPEVPYFSVADVITSRFTVANSVIDFNPIILGLIRLFGSTTGIPIVSTHFRYHI